MPLLILEENPRQVKFFRSSFPPLRAPQGRAPRAPTNFNFYFSFFIPNFEFRIPHLKLPFSPRCTPCLQTL